MVGRSRIQLAIAEIEPARLPRIFTLYYSHLQGCGCAAQGARGFDFNTGPGAAETVLAARGDQWYQYAQSHSAHSDADRLEIDGGNRNRTRLPITRINLRSAPVALSDEHATVHPFDNGVWDAQRGITPAPATRPIMPDLQDPWLVAENVDY
jgi:hypothetical protein